MNRFFHISGFFILDNISSLDHLKKEYYRLAKIHHPDAGGSNEEMKAVNKEYEELFKRLLAGQNLTSQEQDLENQINEAYKEVIDQIIKIPGLQVEMIGLWIWVSGNTYPVREELKKAGFLFASKKKMWFWRPAELKSSNFKEYSIDDIRNKYGSQVISPGYSNTMALNGIPSLRRGLKRIQALLSFKARYPQFYVIRDIRKRKAKPLHKVKSLKKYGIKITNRATINGFAQADNILM